MPRSRSAAALALLAVWLATSAGAQSRATSDAVILVAPLGGWGPTQASGQIAVSVSFPRAEDHALVRRRMQALASALSWRPLSVEVKDEDVRAGPYKARQTGANCVYSGPVPWRGGGFWIQPFVEVFRDLNRIEVLFYAPPDRTFQGLREFDSPTLSVHLVQFGGPYRYIVDVRSHRSPLPVLPLTQPPTVATKQQARPQAGVPPVSYGPVLILAGVVGLLVLAGMLVRLRVRAVRGQGSP